MNSPKPSAIKSPHRPSKRSRDFRTPALLYHGTPAKNFNSILDGGLIAFSRGEKGVKPYISFSDNPVNTPVLSGNKPSDVIFRVSTRKYSIFKGGAGKGEFRTNDDIAVGDMRYIERKELKQKPVPWKRVVKAHNIEFV